MKCYLFCLIFHYDFLSDNFRKFDEIGLWNSVLAGKRKTAFTTWGILSEDCIISLISHPFINQCQNPFPFYTLHVDTHHLTVKTF